MKSIHGNKTYAMAAVAIAGAWIAYFFQVDLGEGMVSLEDALFVTIGALSAAFLRHGVKSGPGAGGAAALILAVVLVPGCSLLQSHDGSERAAKLRYADALQGVTTVKRTVIRLYDAGVIDAEAVVRIDAIVEVADDRLEQAWNRIVAGDHSPETFALLDFVLESIEQVTAITIELQKEPDHGLSTGNAGHHDRTGPDCWRIGVCGTSRGAGGLELRAA